MNLMMLFQRMWYFGKIRRFLSHKFDDPFAQNLEGGMKNIEEEISSITFTHAIQVYKDENEKVVKDSIKVCPHALQMANAWKVMSITLKFYPRDR